MKKYRLYSGLPANNDSRIIVALCAVLLLEFAVFSAWYFPNNSLNITKIVTSGGQSAQHENNLPNSSQEIAANEPVPVSYLLKEKPFIFGVGTELDHAIKFRITKEAPVRMLSSWYNGPQDLSFMKSWRSGLIPKAYRSGYSLHLIIYTNEPEKNINTKYGKACGRPYPLSERFISDMKQLAQVFSGGKLYVSMFTEFQTYPCEDNTWAGGENYYRAMQDQYLAAVDVFHQYSPGSQVSLSWGGWQANWDDRGNGGGISLLKYFEEAMNASDFQSFQAMDNHNNLEIISKMTKALSPYSGGVMVSHYKPDFGSQSTFDQDIVQIFTPENIAEFKRHELFAFSFMDNTNMQSSEPAYQAVKKAIKNYAR